MERKDEIKAEYGKLCQQAGELQFKIKEGEAMLDHVNQKMFELNKEYIAIMNPPPPDKPGMVTNETFKEA